MKHQYDEKTISVIATAIDDVQYIKDTLCDFKLKNIAEAFYALGQLQAELCAFYHSIKKEDE